MDLRLSEDQQLLRRSIREFAESEIRPHVREWDEAQHFPEELLPRLGALGLMGIQFPEQYGGAAMCAAPRPLCAATDRQTDGSTRASSSMQMQ